MRRLPIPFLVLGLVLSGALFSGCESRTECERLSDAEKWEEATRACEASFMATGEVEAALNAAEAALNGGTFEAVLSWDDRLAERGVEPTPSERARLDELMASSALRLGDFEHSAELYRSALGLFREVDDATGMAKAHYGLFYLAWSSSELEEALIQADAAATAARRAQEPTLESNALQGLLALRYDLGDLAGAWQTLAACRELAEKNADPDSPSSRSAEARLLVYEGNFRLDENRFSLGRDALERALGKATGEEETAFFRSVHLNLVRANLELADFQRARHHLEEARSFLDDAEDVPVAFLAHEAELALGLGDFSATLRAARRALGAEPIADWRWFLELMVGQAHSAEFRDAEAAAAFERSISTIEAMRGDLGFSELRTWLLDAKREPYERLFALHAEAGRVEEAVTVFARAKARSFLDAQVAAMAPDSEGGVAEAALRLRALRELMPLMHAAGPSISSSAVESVAWRFDPKSIENETLGFFDTPGGFWALSLSKAGSIKIGKLDPGLVAGGGRTQSAESLDAQIDAVVADPGDVEAGQALSRSLRLEEWLPDRGARLLLIMDGRLGEVSFAALSLGSELLIDRHELVYTPGLRLERVAPSVKGSSRKARAGRAVDQSFAAPRILGDPRDDLPAARREAIWVADFLGQAPSLGGAAIYDPTQSPPPRLLHVAGHSGLSARGPWLGQPDGRLYGAEIVAAGKAPEITVLASCSGGARRGKGLWGSLAGSFLAAGSRHVLASLWSAEDEATSRFLQIFYAEGAAEDPARALVRAQRRARSEGMDTEHWAAFVLLAPT